MTTGKTMNIRIYWSQSWKDYFFIKDDACGFRYINDAGEWQNQFYFPPGDLSYICEVSDD